MEQTWTMNHLPLLHQDPFFATPEKINILLDEISIGLRGIYKYALCTSSFVLTLILTAPLQKIKFCPYLGVDLLGMFQDADDISHHLNAHVIENILKDSMETQSVKVCAQEY